MLEEFVVPNDQVEVRPDGTIQVREATVIVRDGVRDESFPPRYHRYVLAPGDDLTDRHPQIVAIAQSIWTDEVIAAHAAKRTVEP